MKTYLDLNIKYQGGELDISDNKLVSLDGSPNHITGSFKCDYNNLTSLVGGPQIVDGSYYCTENNLTDLAGCASHISDTLYCIDNDITSLVGIHKIIKSCKQIEFDSTKILVGGIGLLLIADLDRIANWFEPFDIISKYIGYGTKGMMACRAELIEKGYSPYAKL